MKLLRFDLRRLWSSKVYIVLILLSIGTVFLSTLYLKSHPSLDYERNNHVDSYEQYLLMALANTEEFVPGQLSKGLRHYYKIVDEPHYETRESFLGYPVNSFNLIVPYFKEAFSLEQRELSTDQKQMLDYIQEVNNYMEQNDLSEPPTPFLYNIVKSADFLFGLIPLFIFNILLLKLLDDDLRVNHVLLSILPLSVRSVPFFRKLAVFMYIFLYILLSIMVMWCLSDDKSLHLFYPTRSIMSESTIVPLYQALLFTILLFVLRFFLLASIGILCFMRLKQLNSTIIYQTIITFIMIYFGNFVISHSGSWMPFDINHKNQILGNLERYYVGGRWETYLTGKPIRFEYLIGWLVILLILLMVIDYVYPMYCQNLDSKSTKPTMQYEFHTTIFFEFIKNWRAHRISQLLGIFCVILILFVGHGIVGDFYRIKDPYISKYTHENYGLAIKFYEDAINQLEEEKALLDPNDRSAIQAYQATINDRKEILVHYQRLYNQWMIRKDALELNDINRYISSFDYEMLLYFNPNNHFNIVDDTFRFMPRNNYYVAGDFPTEFGYSLAKDRLLELKKRGIDPLGGEAIIYNYHDQPRELLNQISDRLNFQVADISFLGMLSRLFLVYRIDMLIIFFLLIAAMSDYEVEGERGKHEAWLYTLPLSSKRIFDSKLKASLATASILISCVIILSLLVGIGFQKFGYINYPMVYFTKGNNYEWMDLWKVMGMIVIIFYLIVCLLSIINLIISQWARTIVIKSSVLIFLMIFFYRMSLTSSVGRYSPFAYLNIADVVDGSVFTRYLGHESSFIWPIFILVFWNLVFYALGIILVTKVERRELK